MNTPVRLLTALLALCAVPASAKERPLPPPGTDRSCFDANLAENLRDWKPKMYRKFSMVDKATGGRIVDTDQLHRWRTWGITMAHDSFGYKLRYNEKPARVGTEPVHTENAGTFLDVYRSNWRNPADETKTLDFDLPTGRVSLPLVDTWTNREVYTSTGAAYRTTQIINESYSRFAITPDQIRAIAAVGGDAPIPSRNTLPVSVSQSCAVALYPREFQVFIAQLDATR